MTVWFDGAFVGQRASVPITDAFHTQRNGPISETDCEGSAMPGPESKSEPDNYDLGARNPSRTTQGYDTTLDNGPDKPALQNGADDGRIMQPPVTEGQALVDERAAHYGHPRDNFARIALVWQGVTGRSYTVHEVALMLTGVKLARLVHGYHEDSVADLSGYAATIREVRGE